MQDIDDAFPQAADMSLPVAQAAVRAVGARALVPSNGPAKRQVELMTCRRAATADGSDGAGARRGGPEEVAICA